MESFTTRWGLGLVQQPLVEVTWAVFMCRLELLVGSLMPVKQGSSQVELQAVE